MQRVGRYEVRPCWCEHTRRHDTGRATHFLPPCVACDREGHRGLETFVQIAVRPDGAVEFPVRVNVTDYPRFAYRGLMIGEIMWRCAHVQHGRPLELMHHALRQTRPDTT